MSRRYPVDYRARRRLLDAQRAESKALQALMTVTSKMQTAQARVDLVDVALAEAQSVLVSISGLSRAAELLEIDPRELRRRIKLADQASSGDDPSVTAPNSPPS